MHTGSFAVVFKIYCMYFITEDTRNKVQLKVSLRTTSYAIGLSLLCKIIFPLTKFLKYRRRGIILSLILFAISQAISGSLQLMQKWDLVKYVMFLALPVVDALGLTSYQNFLDELLPQRIVQIAYSNTQLFQLVLLIISPYIFSKLGTSNKGIEIFSFVITGLAITSTILFFLFTFETAGMTRNYIDSKLRGLKVWGKGKMYSSEMPSKNISIGNTPKSNN